MEDNNLVDSYSDVVGVIEELGKEKVQLLESIIPDDIKQKIKEINEEFDFSVSEFEKVAESLREEIKKEVLAQKQTLRGKNHMAVYMRPRVSWNDEFLEGLAVVVPEIMHARKEGSPSIQIRKTGDYV